MCYSSHRVEGLGRTKVRSKLGVVDGAEALKLESEGSMLTDADSDPSHPHQQSAAPRIQDLFNSGWDCHDHKLQ
jgi:hypothetical protein